MLTPPNYHLREVMYESMDKSIMIFKVTLPYNLTHPYISPYIYIYNNPSYRRVFPKRFVLSQ